MWGDTRILVCEHAHEHVSWATTFVWNTVVEIKHEKLGDNLHTNTSSYVKISTRTRPCKSNICVKVRLFRVNTSHCPSWWSKQWKLSAQTCPRMWNGGHGCVLISPRGTFMGSCVKIYIQSRLFTVKTSHSAFASVKNNGKFPLRQVLIYVKSCTRTLYKSRMVQRCRMQNNEGVEHSASSDGAAVVVVVNIDSAQSFFVVSLLGQSFSWSYS